MTPLVWIGSLITVLGVAGLMWCGASVASARRSGLDDAALRAKLQRLVAVNYAALAVAAVGLMCVILGLILS